ncbi:hypothetical protein C8A01DRAFT_19675 [Parachaetomium inaequale]|uniref:Uncharacterized protein n=1 Tax=Parachaetomium inaequale TaxID=2588326 RepID=A0AAN6SN83_9PEZI|nr:hypothetical protein C8A01DRAFT_19675 [Parachaetomium inaequale]
MNNRTPSKNATPNVGANRTTVPQNARANVARGPPPRAPAARPNGAGPGQTSAAPAAAQARAAPAAPSEPPQMARTPIPHEALPHLATSIAEALKDTPYALMGGAALRLLGSRRPTAGIDIFVDDKLVAGFKVAQRLAATGRFGMHGPIYGYDLWYWAPDGSGAAYKVTIWRSRQLDLPFPSSADGFVTAHGARLLKPAVQLNFKCRYWSDLEGGWNNEIQQSGEAYDILFLLDYMSTNKIKTTNQEVGYATEEFCRGFVSSRPETRRAEPLFRAIGLNTTGATGTAVAQGQRPPKA